MDAVPSLTDRAGLAVTIDDPVALAAYDDAVEAIVLGRPPGDLIAECLRLAPRFALAIACEAIVTGKTCAEGGWPPPVAGLTRRERQHIEIVGLVLAGDRRASGLAAEHLTEFPTDRLIRAIAADP